MEVTSLNINKSEIARELNVDRRTVAKYIDGFQKATTRKRDNALTDFYPVIQQLLDPKSTQVLYYKRVLHQYLKDNHGYTEIEFPRVVVIVLRRRPIVSYCRL